MDTTMSNLVQVKIKTQTVTSRYGVLEAGDILRTDRGYAQHLVEQCKAAEYLGETESKQGNVSHKPKKQNKSPGKD